MVESHSKTYTTTARQTLRGSEQKAKRGFWLTLKPLEEKQAKFKCNPFNFDTLPLLITASALLLRILFIFSECTVQLNATTAQEMLSILVGTPLENAKYSKWSCSLDFPGRAARAVSAEGILAGVPT